MAATTTSKKGVSVRNPELEANIEADPGDADRYLVYADWLQQQQDPLGELIIVQHGIATSPNAKDVTRFERNQAELLKRFKQELLGDNWKNTFLRYGSASMRAFSWRHGFVRSARFGPLDGERAEAAVRHLLTRPIGRFVERLILGRLTSSLLSILQSQAPKTLQSLVIGDCSNERSNLERLGEALPQLRRLHVLGHAFSPEPYEAPALEEMRMTLAGLTNFDTLCRAEVSGLRSLRLELSSPLDLTSLGPALARFPALEALRIDRFTWGSNMSSPPDDALALAIASSPAMQRLAYLRLGLPLSESGMQMLARQKGISSIATIELPRAPLLGDSVREELERALPSLQWINPPAEDEAIDELGLPELDLH